LAGRVLGEALELRRELGDRLAIRRTLPRRRVAHLVARRLGAVVREPALVEPAGALLLGLLSRLHELRLEALLGAREEVALHLRLLAPLLLAKQRERARLGVRLRLGLALVDPLAKGVDLGLEPVVVRDQSASG
jgi:hypothetical protein